MNKEKTNPTSPTNQTLAQLTSTTLHYSGPLPPASELANYERILPGISDRLVTLAENNNAHSITLQKEQVKASIEFQNSALNKSFINKIIGQFAGLIIALSAFYFAYKLIEINMPGLAIASIIAAISALIGCYMYGHRKQS